jgi:predicted RNA-binding protein with PUA-like domain
MAKKSAKAPRRYWLMKSEPTCYSIDDLARDRVTGWSGVRNYQVRNFMRDDMRVGDIAFFYHSSAEPTGVAGVVRIASAAKPDLTALDPKDDHYDPKSTPEEPIWLLVDVEFVAKLPKFVTLADLKAESKLAGLAVTQRGSRLSVQPVSAEHFAVIAKMGGWKEK